MKSDDHKPTLAIITESIRRDNHAPLRFFARVKVVHFYGRSPYQDMTKEEFTGAVHFRNVLDLYRKLMAAKPDLIQGTEPYASRRSLLLSLVTMRAAARLGIPFIFPTLENLSPDRRFRPLVARLLRRYFSSYARQAKAIIALNNGAAANLRMAGIPDTKIIRFPWGIWGVDRTVFRHTTKQPHPAFTHPTILFAGRLDPEKGIIDLLHAFGQLAPDHPDWQLALVGRGMLEAEVQTFARAHKLTDRILHIGWIPSRELPQYFSSVTVTVYPSVTTRRGETAGIQGWTEQVGTVILQSLSCGTPVIGTRSGAIPEYLPGDAGLLVPEHDPEQLAAAIQKIMTDSSLRDRFSRNGSNYVARNFDAQQNIRKAEDMVVSWVSPEKR